MNKKTEKNQIKQLFNYLLNLGRVTSEGSINLLLPEVSPLLPVSSLKEKSLLSNLKVVRALISKFKNYHFGKDI